MFDPERKEKEQQRDQCTFQPSLDKSQFVKIGQVLPARESETKINFFD